MTIEIKIKLKVGKHELELTLDEARALHWQLSSITEHGYQWPVQIPSVSPYTYPSTDDPFRPTCGTCTSVVTGD